jgi:hypothetical protein
LDGVDAHVVLVLLASALGVYDPDDAGPGPDPEQLARHGPVLVADLLAGTPRPLAAYLTAAFTEIQRGELQD